MLFRSASLIVGIVFCLWAVQMTRVVRRVPHFGAGIVWGTISSGFPIFWIIVPGCSRNGYGTSPNLWVQKKLAKLWQGTQDTWLCSAKFFWEFLSYSAFNLLRNLGDVILSQFRVKCVLSSTVSIETAASFLLFLNVAMRLGEMLYQRWREFELYFCNESDYLLWLWGKRVSKINTTVNDFQGTISNHYNIYNHSNTLISPIYTFPWRET